MQLSDEHRPLHSLSRETRIFLEEQFQKIYTHTGGPILLFLFLAICCLGRWAIQSRIRQASRAISGRANTSLGCLSSITSRMALTFRERTGHQGVNRHRYLHLPVQERSHYRRNSHMGFLLLAFPILAGCLWGVLLVLVPYHDSFVDHVFSGKPLPSLTGEHKSVASVRWNFSAWSFPNYPTRNPYGVATQTTYKPQDPISYVPKVGGAPAGGGFVKRDITQATYGPTSTFQHLHPFPAHYHAHQQPMATGVVQSIEEPDENVVIHGGWKI